MSQVKHVLAIAGCAAALALAGPLGRSDQASTAPALFREVLPEESRIDWVHDNALSPDRYLPETTGAGAAIFDFDGDGWMDVYLVNSGPCDLYRPRVPLSNALYRNNRDGTFTDVTDKAGVAGGTFGMGATAGDLLARDVVCRWLRESGVPHDVALAPPFRGGVDWRAVDPRAYRHVVFVCGPFGDGYRMGAERNAEPRYVGSRPSPGVPQPGVDGS